MKNTFLESPVIALQHIKNSAWAIEKIYNKACARKGFLCTIYTTIRWSRKHNFYPCSDEIQGSKKRFGTWLHLTRLHSGEDQSFQLHIGGKSFGQTEKANSENIFKTGH